jgi:endonuclease/exonuclease/phosphatase family metal-dependent hydrolase
MGDMNARTYHPALDHFRQSFQDAWSIAESKGFGEHGYEGKPFNKHRIDQILFSHNHWDDTVSGISMLVLEGSDHYPIFADIVINPNPETGEQ